MRDRSQEIDDAALRQMELEMQDDLRGLRESATVYAERSWARGEGLAPLQTAARSPWRSWALGATAAALLVLGGIGLVHEHSPSKTDASQSAATPQLGSPAVSDEALLEQIQGDLSSGVPAAMQPLETTVVRSPSATEPNRSE